MADADSPSAAQLAAPLAQRHLVPSVVWWVAHAVVLIEVGVATRWFAFFQDDYVFLNEGRGDILRDGVVHGQPLTFDYLRASLFEHFSPLTRLAFWVVGHSESPQVMARVLVLALVAVLIVALGVLSRTILGRTMEALLLTMVAGQGLVVVHLAGWTTASFNLVPALALCALSFAAGIRYLRDRQSPRYAVASLCLFGLGLFDYELTMFLPVFIGCWFLLCLAPELGVRAAVERIVHTFAYWGLFAVLTAAAALNFKLNYMQSGLPKPTVGQFVETMWHAWWQGLFPSVLGVSDIDHGAGAAAVVAIAVWVWLMTVAVVQLGPRVIGAIALGLLGWFLCTAALAWGRAAVNTPWVGIDLFYAAVPLVVLVVAVAEALRLPRPSRRRRAGRRVRVVSVLGALVLISGVLTQVHARQATDPNGVASAARNFQLGFLRAVAKHHSPPAVVSAPVPEAVVLGSFYPYNYISRSVGILTDRVRWDVADSGPLYRVDTNGELVQVGLEPRAQANMTRIRAFEAQRAGGGHCFRMHTSKARLTVPLATPVSGPNLAVRTEGRIDRTSAARPFLVRSDDQRVGATGSLIRWQKGDIHSVMLLTSDSVTAIGLTGFVPGSTICLESVVVGSLTDSQ
jgi:hypothetical protein